MITYTRHHHPSESSPINWAAAALAGSGPLAGQVGRGQLCRGGACSRLDDGDDDNDFNTHFLFWIVSDRPLHEFEVILSNMCLGTCSKRVLPSLRIEHIILVIDICGFGISVIDESATL